MRIWKFPLTVKDEQTIELPKGAKILSIQTQGGIPMLWALVYEHETRKQGRRIALYRTGAPLPDNPGEYVATFQIQDGALVLHAFER